MSETEGREVGTSYAYSCPDCGVDREVVASLDAAQDRFASCTANDHAPMFERIGDDAADDVE